MKNNSKLLSIMTIVIIALLFTSCSKDSTTSAVTNTLKSTMSATITGALNKNFSSTTVTHVSQTVATITVTAINGTDGTTSIVFDLTNLALGSQTVDLGLLNQAVVTNGTTVFSATTGTLTITENNNTDIKGTFTFSGGTAAQSNEFSVTNGTFTVYK